MAHQVEKKEDINSLYYLVGMATGLFIGTYIDLGINYIIAGGITGLLFAAFFTNVLVKGRADS
jgi:hypothetical protein